MDLVDMVNILLALLGFLLRPGVLNTERVLQHGVNVTLRDIIMISQQTPSVYTLRKSVYL